MDIPRPDLKAKKTTRRRVILGTGIVVILVAVAVLLFRVEARPRHEYVTLTYGAGTVRALVVSPKLRGKASVVVLVHEVYGLTDWAKEMADELADEGFIVIAPDFLSGNGPHGGGFDDFPSESDRVSAIQALNPDVVLEDCRRIIQYQPRQQDRPRCSVFAPRETSYTDGIRTGAISLNCVSSQMI